MVPRTFWGASILSALVYPAYWAKSSELLDLHFPASLQHPLLFQLLSRFVLGFLGWLAFRRLMRTAGAVFGADAAACATLLTAFQFHLPFYMSRTLPNTFALLPAMLGCEAWLKGSPGRALGLLTLTCVIFRCDVVLLLGPLALQLLLQGRVRFWEGVGVGLRWGLASLASTLLLDSYFWGRWLWPEGEVLFFNTVENRSSEWGTQPFHWYFASAVPRALGGGGVLLALLGLLVDPLMPRKGVDGQAARVASPAVCFMALYSTLPHKELRFLFPVLPLLNLLAGLGLAKLLRCAALRPSKGKEGRALFVRATALAVGCMAVLVSVMASGIFLYAAVKNYPGGQALDLLHRRLDFTGGVEQGKARPLKVHIDALAAMTGVSRFGERSDLEYSKQEGDIDLTDFDFLLTGDPSSAVELGFSVVDAALGFTGLGVHFDRGFLGMLSFRTSPLVFVMEKADATSLSAAALL